jgi:hypothetical protein
MIGCRDQTILEGVFHHRRKIWTAGPVWLGNIAFGLIQVVSISSLAGNHARPSPGRGANGLQRSPEPRRIGVVHEPDEDRAVVGHRRLKVGDLDIVPD